MIAGEPATKKGKANWLRAGFVLIVLAAGYSGYLHFRNRLGIVGGDKSKIRVLARESFGAKPIIDVKLPVVGQLTYPEKGDLPQGYVDTPGVSGLLLVDAQAAMTALGPSGEFVPPKWEFDEGGKAESADAGDQLFAYARDNLVIRCPYVFGTAPRVAKVTFSDDLYAEVKIPASGKPEPKLPTLEARAGKWKVRLEPMPWISPSFRLRYRLTLLGGDTEPPRFVEIWGQPDTHAWFSMHEGDTKEFSMENWYTKQPLYIRIYSVKEIPVKIKATITTEKWELAYFESKAAGVAAGELAYSTNGWDNRFAALKAGRWTMYGEGFVGDGITMNMGQIKNGQIFDATAYKKVETGKADVTLDLPRLRDYERTRTSTGSSPFRDY